MTKERAYTLITGSALIAFLFIKKAIYVRAAILWVIDLILIFERFASK